LRDFTTGNATRQIILFSLPLLLGNLFQQMYNAIAAMIVGQYIGGGALAAVGVCAFVMNFMLSIITGLTTGASVLISQFYGARQEENLRRTVSTSLVLLMAFTAVISIIGVVFAPSIIRIMDVPDDIFTDAVIYLRILMGGNIFGLIYNLYAAYLRALGDTRRPLYILVFSLVLNLSLTLLFVLLLNLGVAGAAWAIIAAQLSAAVLIYIYVLKCAPILKIKTLVFDRSLVKSVLRYSIPVAVQLSITNFASLIIVRLVSSFGSAAIAGFSAAVRIEHFMTLPISTLSLAISTFVAQNMGAGLEERAKHGFRSSILFGAGLALCLTGVVMLLGQNLIAMFVDASDPDSAEIIRIGTEYMLTLAVFYVTFAFFFGFIGFFQGVGDAVIAMVLPITSFMLRASCSYLLAHFTDLGVTSLAYAIMIGWTFCGLFSLFYYKKRFWVGKMVVKREESPQVRS